MSKDIFCAHSMTKQVRLSRHAWQQLKIYALMRGMDLQDAATHLIETAIRTEQPLLPDIEFPDLDH